MVDPRFTSWNLLASWVRQIGTAATGAAYALLHTMAFVLIYILGSLWLMAAIAGLLAIGIGAYVYLAM